MKRAPKPPGGQDGTPVLRDGTHQFRGASAGQHSRSDRSAFHQLPPGQFGGPEVLALFTNQLDWDAHPYFQTIRGLQVSAHFFINRSGNIWQLVSCDQRAWHAGQSQYRGRGNCNDFSIGIELEGLEGGRFESAIQSTGPTVPSDQATLPHRPHCRTRTHCARTPKPQDPGAGFDWVCSDPDSAGPKFSFPIAPEPLSPTPSS